MSAWRGWNMLAGRTALEPALTYDVDHDTLEGKGVTVRERDSQKQIRVKEADLPDTLTRLLSGESSFVA